MERSGGRVQVNSAQRAAAQKQTSGGVTRKVSQVAQAEQGRPQHVPQVEELRPPGQQTLPSRGSICAQTNLRIFKRPKSTR